MSDELEQRLAAWLDGALSPEDALAFELELERNPALALRAANWKANDAFIAGALAPLAETPIDPALLARMGLAEPAVPMAANDNPPWWRRRALPIAGGAIAAGLALVLVLTGQPGTAPGNDALSLALDTTPSLSQATLADGRTIEPRLTVRASDGRWCREFASSGKVALACREAQGWKVVGEVSAFPAPAHSGEVVLAGGEDTGPLDAAYAAIGASDPLDAAAEAGLIKGKWQGQ